MGETADQYMVSKYCGLTCDVIGCDVIGCDVIGRDVIGCDIIGRDVIGCDVIGCDVIGGVVPKESSRDTLLFFVLNFLKFI